MINDELKPRRLAGVLHYRLVDEMVLYDPASSRAASLNEAARAIWELSDGTRTVAQICTELAEKYGVSPDVIHEDIDTAIQLLFDLQLLSQ